MRLPEVEKLGRWRIDEEKAIPMLLRLPIEASVGSLRLRRVAPLLFCQDMLQWRIPEKNRR